MFMHDPEKQIKKDPDQVDKQAKVQAMVKQTSLFDHRKSIDLMDDTKVCKLCNREQPLYFTSNEQAIKMLPERSLTPLLQEMRRDLDTNKMYFKYIKVTNKFIKPCACKRKEVHSYCMTASVIRNQRIYCEKCKSYYSIYIQ